MKRTIFWLGLRLALLGALTFGSTMSHAQERGWGKTSPPVNTSMTAASIVPRPIPEPLMGYAMALSGLPVITDSEFVDPDGDAYTYVPTVDLTKVSAGSNGVVFKIRLEFSAGTKMSAIGGYVSFNRRGNTKAGRPFTYLSGLKAQGRYEAYAQIFDAYDLGKIYVYDDGGYWLATCDAKVNGQSLEFEVPLSALEDEGNIDIAAVVGNQAVATDWAPEKTPLEVVTSDTQILPNGGELASLQAFDLALVYRNPKGVKVYATFYFLDGARIELDFRHPVPVPGVGPYVSYSDAFHKRLGVGTHDFLVAHITERGLFINSAEFEVSQKFR